MFVPAVVNKSLMKAVNVLRPDVHVHEILWLSAGVETENMEIYCY